MFTVATLQTLAAPEVALVATAGAARDQKVITATTHHCVV